MKKLSKYLLWAFGAAWILQIIAGILFRKGNSISYSVLLALSMFAPLLASVMSGAEIRRIGWKPHIKGNFRWILIAWFVPAILGMVGAALYFLLVPNAFDTTFAYVRTLLGNEGLSQLESNGLSGQTYAIISVVSAITYAPCAMRMKNIWLTQKMMATLYDVGLPTINEHYIAELKFVIANEKLPTKQFYDKI